MVRDMSETWTKRALYFAGAWNVIGSAGALSLDDPLQAFFFRATWINVIAWGIGYILAGRHSAARGPVLIAGGAGKLAYFGACLALFLSGRGSTMLLAAGILDVIFAAFLSIGAGAPGSGRLVDPWKRL